MPRKLIFNLTLMLGLCLALSHAVRAQDCAPPQLSVDSRPYNIFSPEQEMILGDLTYQSMTRDLRFVRDPQLTAYLEGIGQKLIKHLPQTGLKFQFHIIDLSEANAFNTPGGHVFMSRKLIAFARNEDELAGVVAHELGHATVHHSASDFSVMLKEILNVTQLGDRKDITDKFNLLLERGRTKNTSLGEGHEFKQQLEADRIGVFATAAAGYDPHTYADFTNRLEDIQGKTGNRFTDIFGHTKPEEKILRAIIKSIEQLPAQCRDQRKANASTEYLKWQADVISFRESNRTEELPGLRWKKALTPKLRSDISHLAFSNDGAYFLAQDDFAITVIQREPLQVLFQIPAKEAREASFTPDGKFVVFGTDNLRYEKWSIANKQSVEIREFVVTRHCLEHEFSPDGKYLVCVDYDLTLNILETRSGQKIWEKKDFYRLSYWEYWTWTFSRSKDEKARAHRFFNMEFSPDSGFVIVSRSNKFRFSYRFNGITEDETEDTLLALDLNTLKVLNTGGDLKKVARRSFVFLDSNRIIGMPSRKAEDSGIFSFPDGKRLAKFPLGGEELRRTGNPDYVVVKPLAKAKLGVVNITHSNILVAMDKEDVAFWNDLMIYESTSGKVIVAEAQFDEKEKVLHGTNVKTVDIPVSPIGKLAAAELSDNFQWLAISSKSRGAVWNLNSGEQKMLLRGFRGAVVANNGDAIGDFLKRETTNHSLVFLHSSESALAPLREIPEKGASQYRQFLLLRSSLNPQKKPLSVKLEAAMSQQDDEADDTSLNREVRFEVRNIVQDKTVWSREFPKEAPGYFFDELSGRLILYWTLGSEQGKARLKEDAALAARANELDNKTDDYLLEVVDAFAGKTIGTLLLETGKGSFNIQSGFSERDWLVLYDDENRVLAYSIKEGALRHRFFGANAAANPMKDQLVVENYPGELTFYDLKMGDSQARLVLNSGAAFVRFSLDGKSLFVLSDEQTAYVVDLESLNRNTSSATQTKQSPQ